jgi:hypothetical protein
MDGIPLKQRPIEGYMVRPAKENDLEAANFD